MAHLLDGLVDLDSALRIAADLAPLLGILLAISLSILLLGWAVVGRTVGVTCWFCSKRSKVDKWSVAGWTCPHCDQYNGFTEDGDYNKSLPQQAEASLNKESPAVRRSWKPQRTVLCSICTHNQALKMQHRATFEPTSEATFEEEAERFNRRLEVAYRLCSKCESSIQDELVYQRRTVVSANMRPVRAHDIVVPTKGFSLSDWLFPLRSIPIVAAVALFCFPSNVVIDTVFIFLWLVVFIFVYISNSFVRPSSFLPFVLMVFAFIVNIFFVDIPHIQYPASDTTQMITSVMQNPFIRATLYLLVAKKSSRLKPPLIQPKPITSNTSRPSTHVTHSPTNMRDPLSSFDTLSSFGLQNARSNVQPNSGTPNRFSRSTAALPQQLQQQQQRSEDFGTLGDLGGVLSLDVMLSRVEISQNETKQKPNPNRLRNICIGSSVFILIGLLYYGFVVNESEL